MGINLVRECAEKFAHLNANPFKALNWMCFRALDAPNQQQGIPGRLWFADWHELAHAMGWEIPPDPKRRTTMRNNVSKVCRELVAAGAIEKTPHPSRLANAAYHLVLDPKSAHITDPEAVDNGLQFDFDSVDSDAGGEVRIPPRGEVRNPPRGEVRNPPRGEVRIPPRGEVRNPPPPINRNEDGTEEGVEEGVEEKGEDDTYRRDQPPGRKRPVDNLALTSGMLGALGRVRDAMAGATPTEPRHARPTPPPVVRPDRE